jgi:Cellulose binding domain
MVGGTLQRLRSFGLGGLLAFTLLHCAAGEELDPGAIHDAGARKDASKTGSGGGLAAGGAAGDLASGGASGTGVSSTDDASSTGGQGGAGGGAAGAPADSGAGGGAAGGAMADVVTYDVAPCPTCALTVQYSLQKTADPGQEIGFNFTVKNTGNKAVPVNQIAVRYWYTIDGDLAQDYGIDYSNPGGGATIQFVKVMPARAGADYYAEIKFGAGGDLAMGQTGELHVRFHKTGYPNYTQSDDYSYGVGHTTLGDWPKMTAYVAGTAAPVWGTEP